MAPTPDARTRPNKGGMADDNRDQTVFKPVRPNRVPRPPAWRVVMGQVAAGLVLLAVSGLWFPETVRAVLYAGVLSVLAHSYFTWRSLRHYGHRTTGLFVLGASQALFGKWIIVAFGLITLWLTLPDLNAIALLLTVCVLNTLAAALTPILVK